MSSRRRKTTRQLAIEQLAREAERLSLERGRAGHTQFELVYLDLAIFLRELAGTSSGWGVRPTLGQLRLLDS